MNDASALRIAAVFSFLSPLTILLGIPAAASLRGAAGPGPIDFGDGAVLARLAELGAAPIQVDFFALLGPVLALPAGFGWYLLLRSTSRLAALGVVLWYVGMIFVIFQDALQLALVSTLPATYAGADLVARVALEGFGASLAYTIEVLAFTGHLPNGLGFLLLGLVMLRSAAVPKWLGGLAVVASVLLLAADVLSFTFPSVEWLGVGVPVGVFMILACIAGLGVVMWGAAKRGAVPAAVVG